MSHLKLLLLGPPHIELDDAEVVVDTRKAVALLAYLALTGQRERRDTIAALLWPDYSQVNARASLRRTLSTMNKALRGRHLIIERETLELSTTGLLVDVRLFKGYNDECLLHGHAASEVCRSCVSPLTAAAELYRGDFLAGFTLRDSPDFDDWQIYQAESLHRDLATTLEKLARCYAGLSSFDKAIEYARRWLSLDRLHEPAHRYLMLLYAWSGRRANALQQYRECIQALQRDLGVAPLEATTQLYNRIKENMTPAPPAELPEAQSDAALRPSSSATPGLAPTRHTGHIIAADTPPPVTPALSLPAPPHTHRPPDMPMVGRAGQWTGMLENYPAAGKGGGLLALSGEAGVGKTRLAEEFLAYAASMGAITVTARCYQGESNLVYGPVAEALRAALRVPAEGPEPAKEGQRVLSPRRKDGDQRLASIAPPWLVEVVRLLPELTLRNPGLPAPPPLDSPGAQSRFFEGIRQAFLSLLSGPAPGVLFFDDAHWADGATLDLLTYLARRLRDFPVCLLLSWRTEEVEAGSRLPDLVAEARRKGDATLLHLRRLSLPEVSELVQSSGIKNEPGSSSLAERLYRETEGLPFFLVEYLGALTQNREESPGLPGEWPLPGSVRDLLSSRLRTVSEAGLQILTTAAVLGRSFDFDTLQQASGRSEEESVQALEELIARGLVIEIRGNSPTGSGRSAPGYDFSHEKLRNLVYEETSLARRRLLHRRIADALSAHSHSSRNRGSHAGQIAQHYRAAGSDEIAAEYYRQAGEYARGLFANAEALAHLQMALALGHPDLAALHEAIGDLQTLLGEYSPALDSYETAASWAASGSGNTGGSGRALTNGDTLAGIEHKLGALYGRRGEWERAESHLAAALAAYGEDGPFGKRARVYADWSLLAYHHGDAARAQELATQAFRLAAEGPDLHSHAQANNMLGILATNRGDLAEARSYLEKSLELAETLADPAAQAAALNNLALAYAAAGTLSKALELAESALSLSVAQGDRPREAAIHSNLADLLHALKRSEEAMRHLKQAVTIYAEIGVEAGDVQPAIWKLTEW
jgi:predicted ATPase/DNA-binding SARP family transcriptional activator